jgi:hypothetical protein
MISKTAMLRYWTGRKSRIDSSMPHNQNLINWQKKWTMHHFLIPPTKLTAFKNKMNRNSCLGMKYVDHLVGMASALQIDD